MRNTPGTSLTPDVRRDVEAGWDNENDPLLSRGRFLDLNMTNAEKP